MIGFIILTIVSLCAMILIYRKKKSSTSLKSDDNSITQDGLKYFKDGCS